MPRDKINDQIEITLEGVNLTDEFNDQFISSQRNSVVVYNHTGREVLAGDSLAAGKTVVLVAKPDKAP